MIYRKGFKRCQNNLYSKYRLSTGKSLSIAQCKSKKRYQRTTDTYKLAAEAMRLQYKQCKNDKNTIKLKEEATDEDLNFLKGMSEKDQIEVTLEKVQNVLRAVANDLS